MDRLMIYGVDICNRRLSCVVLVVMVSRRAGKEAGRMGGFRNEIRG
jgi:hypothetical protein